MLTHAQVHYRQAESKGFRCATCQHYTGNACDIVEPPISPDGWCDKFKMLGPSQQQAVNPYPAGSGSGMQAVNPPAPKWHDVTTATTQIRQRARVDPVPPEEFGIARNARSIRDTGYCFHEVLKSESDLIAQGYDSNQVKNLTSHPFNLSSESMARDTVDETKARGTDEGHNAANRLIRVTEHYVRLDYNGDGDPKLYQVTTGGEEGDILRKDGDEQVIEIDTPPFAAMTPVIITHRFFGRSLADLVMDIQRLKTALTRGMMDNLYLHNNPRVEVGEEGATDNTLDDLLVSRPGGIVRTKRVGSVMWQEVPDITASIYPALQYWDATREWRTGVSRQGQGVDPNALQNQVATIANQMFNAAQAKTKLIARIFAETGIKDLFLLLHAMIRKHGSVADTVRLRNQWVNIDPRSWQEREDMTVSVGLGSGSKSEQLAGAQLLIGAQEKAIPAGLVSPQNLHNSAKLLTKLTGHQNADEFFTPPDPNNPATQQPIPMPPDPRQAEIQAKVQGEQAKAQTDAQHQQARLQLEATLEQQRAQSDLAIAERQAQLKEQQMILEMQMQRERHAMDMAARDQQHRHAVEQHGMSMAESAAAPAGGKTPRPQYQPRPQSDPATIAALNALADGQKAVAHAITKSSGTRVIRKDKDGSYRSETE